MTPQPILEGLVGSHAYGLARPDSDRDWIGVYAAPKAVKLGVRGYEQSHVEHYPEDRTVHEVAKFLNLAAKANPTVVELLWLDEYRVHTPAGQLLIDKRRAILSKRARHSYGGYVRQQARRLVNRGGTFDPDLTKRTEKHGRHCWRLIIQAEWLALKGELRVRLNADEAEECFEAGRRAQLNPAAFAERVEAFVGELDGMFDKSDLPNEPDWAAIDQLALDIYDKEWAT